MDYVTLEKSPDDDMYYEWDYRNEDTFLTDPIASLTVTNWSGGGVTAPLTVGGGVATSDARIWQTRISSGTNLVDYQLKGKATSVGGLDRDIFVKLQVRLPV